MKVDLFHVCLQPSRNPSRVQDLKILCAENEQTRTCWTSAFRLFKVSMMFAEKDQIVSFMRGLSRTVTVLCLCQHGKQLQSNYQLSKSTPRSLEGSPLTDLKVSPLNRKL